MFILWLAGNAQHPLFFPRFDVSTFFEAPADHPAILLGPGRQGEASSIPVLAAGNRASCVDAAPARDLGTVK